MNAPNHNTTRRGLREWWADPPRSGLQRMIWPFEYRHLRAFAGIRFVSAFALFVLAVITFSLGGSSWEAYGFTLMWLVFAVVQLAAGYWELTIAQSQSGQA